MWVLHGVVRAEDRDIAAMAAEALDAAALGGRLTFEPAGDLAVVASDLCETGLATDDLVALLEDPGAAGALAMRHTAILSGLVEHVDVAPARLSVVAPTRAVLIEAAIARTPALKADLERVAGAMEYSVRVCANPTSGAPGLMSGAPGPAASLTPAVAAPASRVVSGRSYSRRRADARSERLHRRETVDAFVAEAAEAIEELARDGVLKAVETSPEPTLRRPGARLEMALLVRRGAVPTLEVMIDALTVRAARLGLICAAIGPWAPFSFVGGEGPDQAGGESFRRAS